MFVFVAIGTAQSQSQVSGSQIRFDIPAQSLASALDAYSAVTGKELFYDGTAGMGRQSTPLDGLFTPENALRVLLEGTGLVILASGPGGYTLLHAPDRAAGEVAAARMASDWQYYRYFAIIQANVGSVLCRSRQTWPGPDRLLIKFRIGRSGALEHPELSGSIEDQVRGVNLIETLRTLTFDEPPPLAMPQPITMAVFPQRRTGRPFCGGTDARSAAR